MRGIKVRIYWWSVCGLLLLAVGACQTGGGVTGSWAWPWAKKPALVEHKSDVLPPTQQTKQLRQLAQEASSRSPDQQQRLSSLLVEALQKQADPLIRVEIVRTLAKVPTLQAAEAVRAATKAPDPDVRAAACQCLGRPGDQAAVITLAEVLSGDLDVDVRLAAARSLGQTQDPKAVQALGLALNDPDPAMQHRAVVALREVTGKDFGNDVQRWRQYVKGEPVAPPTPSSLAERLWQMF